MNLKHLSSEEVREIYINHMILDFPPEELKPIDVIENLVKRKKYKCYALYNDNELLAYAFLATSQKSYLLIDYYAVCSEYRNRGIGSKFFDLLNKHCINYNGIILEVENEECASNETEKIIRKRRIAFYKKNGMRMTNLSSTLFSIEYSIMCISETKLDDSVIYEELCSIYKEIIPNKFHSEYVKVSYKMK